MYKNDSSCAVSITVVRAYKEAVKVAGEVEEVTRACMEWMEEKKIVFTHNPFSMPQGGLEALNT